VLSTLAERGWRIAKRLRQTFVSEGEPVVTVFVVGVQRSGTNMLLDVFEKSWQAEVLRDYDRRVYDDYHVRFLDRLGHIRNRTRARALVLKAQHDTERVPELMGGFPPSRAIWNYRHFEDSVRSILRIWPGTRNWLEELIEDPARAGWRGLGMSAATLAIVRTHYREGMSDASANALFWYYRNQLLFDRRLERDHRVVVVRYEDLAHQPHATLDRLCSFLGVDRTERMVRVVRPESAKRGAELDILPEIRALCEGMLARLDAVRMEIPALSVGTSGAG
jgi:hypothetical protein